MDIKRLDHLGIIAGVIKDLGLIKVIDERLQKDTLNQGVRSKVLFFSPFPAGFNQLAYSVKESACCLLTQTRREYIPIGFATASLL